MSKSVAKMNFGLQFLGTGTSVGIPMIGCQCEVCTSKDPRDNRRRAAALVTLGDKRLLLDAGPDLREQCLKWRVPRVDAVFITHAHVDHLFGFDDLRRFNTIQDNQTITCYAGPETIESIHRIFPYITNKLPGNGLYRPLIDFASVTAPFELLGATCTPLRVVHGNLETYGLRVDYQGHALAYLPDVHIIPDETLALLQGLDLLVLNMLRIRRHPTHLSLHRSLRYAKTIGAKQTFFTHLSHDLTHARLADHLPANIQPAYDGLEVPIA